MMEASAKYSIPLNNLMAAYKIDNNIEYSFTANRTITNTSKGWLNFDYIPKDYPHIVSTYTIKEYQTNIKRISTAFGCADNVAVNAVEPLIPINSLTTVQYIYGNSYVKKTCNVPLNTKLKVDANTNTLTYIDGTQTYTMSTSYTSKLVPPQHILGIFNSNRGYDTDDNSNIGILAIDNIIIYDDSVKDSSLIKHFLIPYINQDGLETMIDLMTMKEAIRRGTVFTIE